MFACNELSYKTAKESFYLFVKINAVSWSYQQHQSYPSTKHKYLTNVVRKSIHKYNVEGVKKNNSRNFYVEKC